MQKNALKLFWIAATFILCTLCLVRLPPQLESRGILLTDESLTLLICAFIFLTLRKRGWQWKIVGLILTVTAFTLPLIRLWQTVESGWNLIFGLFPWSDASGYFLDANLLIQGRLFGAFSGRRPFFSSLLTICLWLSKGNLQMVVFAFASIVGTAAYLLGLEIRAEFGALAGIVVVYLARLFYIPYIGTTLTEQLGFPLGLLALTVLTHAVRNGKKWFFASGLLLATFALLVRNGAFFVLPAIFIFGIFVFGANKQSRMRTALILGLAILIPFLLNFGLGRLVASPDSVQFGNFSDTLYGQAVGGKGWLQIYEDHPQIASLPEPRRSQEVYQLAFQEIKRNPSGLAIGALKSWKDFFWPPASFEYLAFGNQTINLLFQFTAAVLFWMGVWFAWQDKKQPVAGLALAALLGTFVSIPFVPITEAGIRPYAATIALTFLPLAFSIARLTKNKRETNQLNLSPSWIKVASAAGLALPILIILGAAFLKWRPQSHVVTQVCAPSQVQADLHLSPGAYILLADNSSGVKTQLPIVMIKDILHSFAQFPYSGNLVQTFRELRQPVLITFVLDESSTSGLWLIAPPKISAAAGHSVSVCGQFNPPASNILVVESFSVH